jgi:Family of unknown function (DUF6152)
MRLVKTAAIIVGLLVVAVPLLGHHGNAAFESGKKLTIKGTLTDWVWSNPHCFLLVDAKNDDGQLMHWVIEATAIPSLIDIGINKISFKPGDHLTVTFTPVKTGQPIGRVMNVVLPNGKTLYFTPEGSGLITGRGQEEDELMKINKAAQTGSPAE